MNMEEQHILKRKGNLSNKELTLFKIDLERKAIKPIIAWILWFFTGFLGGHRYYLGKTISAIFMTLTFGGFGVWALIDAFLLNKMIYSINLSIENEILNNIDLAFRVKNNSSSKPKEFTSMSMKHSDTSFEQNNTTTEQSNSPIKDDIIIEQSNSPIKDDIIIEQSNSPIKDNIIIEQSDPLDESSLMIEQVNSPAKTNVLIEQTNEAIAQDVTAIEKNNTTN